MFFADGDRWELWLSSPAGETPASRELVNAGTFEVAGDKVDHCELKLRPDASAEPWPTWPLAFEGPDRFVIVDPATPTRLAYQRHPTTIVAPGSSAKPRPAAEGKPAQPAANDTGIYDGLLGDAGVKP